VKLGLLGGSFDPIHRGHVGVARAASGALGLDRVLVLPTARPPHKPGRRFAPALARYAMAELALLDETDLEVSDFELTLDRPAYAIDTVRRFGAPGVELHLVLGADSLAGFAGWREWEGILERASLAVAARPGAEREGVLAALPPELAARLEPARLRWLECPLDPASATEIRRRIGSGEPVPDGWLDPRVLTFVAKYRLYR
jgi:nicotinate-nucleotide adenylyltransferase